RAYLDNIQRMQRDVNQITAVHEDRQSQLQFTTELLGGDATSGTPGLLALQAATRQIVDTAPEEVRVVETRLKQMEVKSRKLKKDKTVRRATLATQCFETQTDPRYKCSPGS